MDTARAGQKKDTEIKGEKEDITKELKKKDSLSAGQNEDTVTAVEKRSSRRGGVSKNNMESIFSLYVHRPIKKSIFLKRIFTTVIEDIYF